MTFHNHGNHTKTTYAYLNNVTATGLNI